MMKPKPGIPLTMLAASFAVAFTAFAKPMWRDPRANSQNRLPARAIAVPCDSRALAIDIAKGKKNRTDSKWIKSLNGEWDFKWKHTIDAEKWEKTGKIKVPGCWQLQGDYDPALYTNHIYPIHGWNEGDPMANVPEKYTSHRFRNPVGLYSRTFVVPAGWKNRRIVIHFGGVSSAMYVYLNGARVGYSEDSRLPAEFDITALVKDGKNLLEVKVLKHCDGSFLEDQDFWRLSGIFRDVWLVSERHDAPFGFNAWPYSQEALEHAKHQTDLSAEGFITVNIDAVQMGVGGDNSWGFRPHECRMVGAGEYGLHFSVEGPVLSRK